MPFNGSLHYLLSLSNVVIFRVIGLILLSSSFLLFCFHRLHLIFCSPSPSPPPSMCILPSTSFFISLALASSASACAATSVLQLSSHPSSLPSQPTYHCHLTYSIPFPSHLNPFPVPVLFSTITKSGHRVSSHSPSCHIRGL